MGAIAIRPFVDRILDGQLDTYLTDRRGEGLSYEAIAKRLYAEHAIEVSVDLVSQWCRELNDGSGK